MGLQSYRQTDGQTTNRVSTVLNTALCGHRSLAAGTGDSPGIGGARGCSRGGEVLSISAGRGQGVERRAGPVVGRDSC